MKFMIIIAVVVVAACATMAEQVEPKEELNAVVREKRGLLASPYALPYAYAPGFASPYAYAPGYASPYAYSAYSAALSSPYTAAYSPYASYAYVG